MQDFGEISGDAIAIMLTGTAGGDVALALIGCGIYQGDLEEPATILDCEAGSSIVSVRVPDGRSRSFSLIGATVVLTASLLDAIGKWQEVQAAAQQATRSELKEFGFEAEIVTEDLADMMSAIRSAQQGRLPSVDERARYMTVMSRYRSPNAFAAVAKAWINASNGRSMPDVLIKLSSALRAADRSLEAIALTDFVHGPCYGLTKRQKQILLTTRASAWLDNFRNEGEALALDEADRCLNEAELLGGPSEHLVTVRRRLARLKRQHPMFAD